MDQRSYEEAGSAELAAPETAELAVTVPEVQPQPAEVPHHVQERFLQQYIINCLEIPKSMMYIYVSDFIYTIIVFGYQINTRYYIKRFLKYDEGETTAILFLLFTFGCANTFFGGVLADSYLGKCFTTWISYVCLAIGTVAIQASALLGMGYISIPFLFVGILVVPLAGLSCLTAFGADQFMFPDQYTKIVRYFCFYRIWFIIGKVITEMIEPILIGPPCFDSRTCYDIMYFSFSIFSTFSALFFTMGRNTYKLVDVRKGHICQYAKCIVYALRQRFSSRRMDLNWLDYAKHKYDMEVVTNTRILLHMALMLLPLFLYNLLMLIMQFEWKKQSTRLTGDFGFYTLKARRTHTIYSVMTLVITILYMTLFPQLIKLPHWRRPLNRMTVAGYFAVLSVVFTAVLSYVIAYFQTDLARFDEAVIRFFNPTNCTMTFEAEDLIERFELESMGYEKVEIKLKDTISFSYELKMCNISKKTTMATVSPEQDYIYYVADDVEDVIKKKDYPSKSTTGSPKIRTISNVELANLTYIYVRTSHLSQGTDLVEIIDSEDYSILNREGTYKFNDYDEEIVFLIGSVYTVLVRYSTLQADIVMDIQKYATNYPNTISMLLLIPPLFLMSFADVVIMISGMEFSYCEAPYDSRALCVSYFYFVLRVGDMIFSLILEYLENLSYSPVVMEITFAVYMTVFSVCFAIGNKLYKYTCPIYQ